MDIVIRSRPAKDGKKIFYSLEWGRKGGQRMATGIFTYAKPANQIEKTHNKEAKAILEMKRSQLVIERQTINSGYIPQHKYKNNFFDYYQEFVENNKTSTNRHLEGSLAHFKKFLKADYFAMANDGEWGIFFGQGNLGVPGGADLQACGQ
jgi:integrase/recombinase XerD